jgi:hypothetical protein
VYAKNQDRSREILYRTAENILEKSATAWTDGRTKNFQSGIAA